MMAPASRVCLIASILAIGLPVIGPSFARDGILPTEDIVGELVVDLDQDGIMDRLFLVSDGNFSDLHAFRGLAGGTAGKDRFVALPVGKEFAFGQPRMSSRGKGIVRVETENSQGRYKWEQTLTLAWRGGGLKVIGVTYSVHDSISERHESRSCDLNLSTGRGIANAKPVRISLKPVPIDMWDDAKLPDYCLL